MPDKGGKGVITMARRQRGDFMCESSWELVKRNREKLCMQMMRLLGVSLTTLLTKTSSTGTWVIPSEINTKIDNPLRFGG